MTRARSSIAGRRIRPDDVGPNQEVFDRFAPGYEDAVDRSVSFTGRDASFFAERKVRLLRLLCNAHGLELSHAALLDVGCGTGTTARHLAGQVKELRGVDVSEEMLAAARQTVPGGRFERYDGKTLPFPEGSFDITIAVCVFHHVPTRNRRLLADELNRVTRPGGIVAVFEHNPANPLTRRAVNSCELDTGVVLLSVREVKRLFEGSGSRVLGYQYYLFTPFGGRIGSTVDGWLRHVPFGGQHVVVAEAAGYRRP